MSNKWKRIIAIIAIFLVALLVLPMLINAIGGFAGAVSKEEIERLEKEAETLEGQIDDLQSKAGLIQDKMQSVSNELSRLNTEKTSALEQKAKLDNEISLLQEQIANTTAIIDYLSLRVENLAQQIAQKESEEAAEYELFKKRVRAMEENKNTSYWGILLKASSFSDLLARIEIIDDLLNYDRQLMSNLKSIRESIEGKKAELEESQATQQAEKVELEAQKADLDVKLAAQQEFILELQANADRYAAAYAEMEANEALVNEAIAAAESKYANKIALAAEKQKEYEEQERKRLEELQKQAALKSGTFYWPSYTSYITCSYGYRVHPTLGYYGLHTGTDIGASYGTEIWAAGSGTVTISTYSSSYGNYVVIDHGNGYKTLYGHMSSRNVSEGDWVTMGDVIGYVGSTGWSTGPHLHFEIINNGTKVDPMDYFD